MKSLLLLFCSIFYIHFVGYSQTIFTTSNPSWVVPAGCTEVFIEVWGGGGGGGSARVNSGAPKIASGGGGVGGMYSSVTVPVTPGETLNITVGAGGAAGNNSAGGNGGNSQVVRNSNTQVLVLAAGGLGGYWVSDGGTGSNGAIRTGNTAAGVGTTIVAGGNAGGAFNYTTGNFNTAQRGYGGGGGGAGGAAGERPDATITNKGSAYSGGLGGTGGGAGGAGGFAGSGNSAQGAGGAGVIPGGGGSIKRSTGTGNVQGGTGARGEVRIHCSNPLSVVLTDFSANCTTNSIEIYWRTLTEHNSSHFILERSRDGYQWTKVETVEGAGTTLQQQHYFVVDNAIFNDVYYRLKQVDYDGQVKIYSPVHIDCNSKVNELIVYPNPNNGSFTVYVNSVEATEESTVFVQDVSGKVVISRNINVFSGINTVHFENTNLVQGTYLVSVHGKDRKRFVPVKLVIQ